MTKKKKKKKKRMELNNKESLETLTLLQRTFKNKNRRRRRRKTMTTVKCDQGRTKVVVVFFSLIFENGCRITIVVDWIFVLSIGLLSIRYCSYLTATAQ